MTPIKRHFSRLLTCLVYVLATSCHADMPGETYLVKSQEEYKAAVKQLKPGDILVLANGIWRDFEILFIGKGTDEKPITLRAEEKGKVVLSGQSNLRLAGEHLIVKGLVFKDGYTPTSAVISFRRTRGHYANHSRVTEVVIDHYNNPERTETDYWVAMYGQHNRFDHNHIEGKSNRGVSMAVRLDSEASRENFHRIDHNYFGPRPILGSNGGETLRIGTSHYSLTDSQTTVENNYFDRCDGKLEIISNKSGKNVYRGNVFFESRGTLTMRHGNGTLVENNVFFGNSVDHTGGIRVINGDQTIRNNYMEGLAGYRFGGALVVMNGVPNSPINRYHQVENALIENNSLINSDHVQLAAGSDAERSAVPVDSRVANNLFYSESGQDIFTVYDDISGIEFDNNLQNQASRLGAELPVPSRCNELTMGCSTQLIRHSLSLVFQLILNLSRKVRLASTGIPKPMHRRDLMAAQTSPLNQTRAIYPRLFATHPRAIVCGWKRGRTLPNVSWQSITL